MPVSRWATTGCTQIVRCKSVEKIDFPRVPLTSDVVLFWQLVALGRELIAAH